MIILHGIPGGVRGRDGLSSFPYSQHDSSMDVPMEQWALAVVSYSLYTYRIELKSNFMFASPFYVSLDCGWSRESGCREQTNTIVFGCPPDHFLLLKG